MGLFDLFKKKDVAKPEEVNTNVDEFDILITGKSNASDSLTSPTVDFDHLTEKGELPWGWIYRNKEFTDQIKAEYSYFLDFWLSSKHAAPKTQCEGLKSFVMYLEGVESVCISKGECFEWWFYNIIASKDYIQKRKEELYELQTNFDAIEKQFNKKVAELSYLDERFIPALEANQGILQSDFVKMFDPIIHNEIKEMLYVLDKEGKLQRTKSGRSYILNYKG